MSHKPEWDLSEFPKFEVEFHGGGDYWQWHVMIDSPLQPDDDDEGEKLNHVLTVAGEQLVKFLEEEWMQGPDTVRALVTGLDMPTKGRTNE